MVFKEKTMQLEATHNPTLNDSQASDKLARAVEHYSQDYFQHPLASSKLRLRMTFWGIWVYSQHRFKRLLDMIIVVLVTPLLMPIIAMTALAIKLESPGPVIFKQTRVGKWGKQFTCYKFRSMRINSDEIKQTLLDKNEADGPIFKIQNDPRITRIGRIIRKTSIDELPQLYNVLKGEMSIVGPRPAVPNEVLEYQFDQRRRLDAIPGLTGLQQVSGRSDLQFERWIEFDMQYIAKQSIRHDIIIILKTIPAVIFGKGAY